jgi:hypothetical protein
MFLYGLISERVQKKMQPIIKCINYVSSQLCKYIYTFNIVELLTFFNIY